MDLITTAIERNDTTLFLRRGNQTGDALFRNLGDNRTTEPNVSIGFNHREFMNIQIGTLLEALADFELLGTFDDLGQPGLRVADQYSNRDGHATLASS